MKETSGERRPLLGRRIRALFGGERVHIDQRALGYAIGRTAIIGDFGFGMDVQSQENVAKRAVAILQSNGIIDKDTLVDIRTLIPSTVDSSTDISREISADRLAYALQQEEIAEQHIHQEPIVVPSESLPNMVLHAYAGISRVVTEYAERDRGRSLLLVANPVFVARVFSNLLHHNMAAGGVAVLAEVGSRPEANRFVQLWPAPPAENYKEI